MTASARKEASGGSCQVSATAMSGGRCPNCSASFSSAMKTTGSRFTT